MKKTKIMREKSVNVLNRNIKGVSKFISGKKGASFLIAMFFILLIILVFSGKEQSVFLKESSHDVEKKLESIISKAEGVETAEVMITYETPKKKAVAGGEMYSFGMNSSGKEDEDSKEEIKGVVVAVKGADDYSVRIRIIDIVKTALDVPANKIEVINMK